MRKLMLVLAFLAMMSQARAGACVPGAAAGGLAHAVAHAQVDAHHHHDDIGLQAGQAGAEGFHVHLAVPA